MSILTSTHRRFWAESKAIKNILLMSIPSQKKSKARENSKEGEYRSPNQFEKPPYSTRQKTGLIIGPALFILMLGFIHPEGMTDEARAVLASTLWIATWWITEAIPIPATSLMPVVLFPLTGALDAKSTTSSYGDSTIFLFMGGFLIALTMEKWGLHKRIALFIISIMGTSTEKIILGFMVATGFLSMWISNTATAMMMVPIGIAIIYQVKDALQNQGTKVNDKDFPFGKALMLGIGYSASIGGLGTLIGTPPNAIFAAVVRELYNVEISFAKWMVFGVPLAALMLIITWLYLVKVAFPMDLKEIPGGKKVINDERKALGKAGYEEKVILIVFILTALAWISRGFLLQKWIPSIDDTMIGIVAALILFAIPSKNKKGERLLDWNTAKQMPWGILLLFGGGLAIAAGFKNSGLAEWIGSQLTVLEGVNFIIIIVAVTTLVLFLTEITSNTATATMMFPIMGSLAAAMNVHPYSLMIAAGIASSCAFMLPVATPPNAVVFGSGYLKIGDMAKAGWWINLYSIFIITGLVYLLVPIAFGIDLQVFPSEWK